MYAEAHKRYLRNATAFLRCKACGKWHGGPIWPITSLDENKKVRRWVEPVTCPHCGKRNCAGPRNTFNHCPRGTGKTELQKLVVAYFVGYCLANGYLPECMVVCQNESEAKKRLAMVQTAMLMPGHAACFPESVPYLKPAGKALTLRGIKNAVLLAYGIEGVPTGFHGDMIWADDVCNMNNTMLKPSLMPKVIDKWNNVVIYSQQPWTFLAWDSTPWRTGDLDHELEIQARANPNEWGMLYEPWSGPNAVYDESGKLVMAPFTSLWPEKFTPEVLKALYEADPVAYQRGIMLQRIADNEIAFQRIHYWMPQRLWKEEYTQDLMEDVSVLKDECWKDWPKYAAIDAGFTGADAKEKKGRSKTGCIIVTIDPETKIIYTLYASQDEVAAGDHLARYDKVFQDFGVRTVALETGAALSEVIAHFERAGYFIERYNPSDKVYGGSKEMRKMPLAQDVNQGMFLVMGYPQFKSSQWSMRPTPRQKPLVDAFLAYPAKTVDLLDAAEMACRTARKYHGFRVPEKILGKKDLTLTEEQEMLETYTRNLGRPPAEPMIPGDLGATFSEIVGDLEAEFLEMGLLN